MYDNTIRNQSPALTTADADAYYAKRQAATELSRAIGNAHEVLLRATTVFPFTLFPDTVVVDRTKLTITHKFFFKVSEVMSIRIEDILNVTAHVGPLFGSVKIATRFFDTKPAYHVKYLQRDDALRLKRVVQGYIIAVKQGINTAALSTQELAVMLDRLGAGAPDEAA